MPPRKLRSASRYNAYSALLAARAVHEANKARKRRAAGAATAIAAVVATHQVAGAALAVAGAELMLGEQGVAAVPEAALIPAAFTTEPTVVAAMLDQAEHDWQFDRLIASLVQDAARSAQSVDTATRNIEHVRHLTPPSCARCAVLAGRVYRYSEGFERHPGCDCSMVPITVSSPPMTADPLELMRAGEVTGLSKADHQAIRDGADFGQVVNVRSKAAGLSESGRVLSRAGRMTPEAIYRDAGSDHQRVLSLLKANGYIR